MPEGRSELDRLFHALGDPTRRAILERLSERPLTVSQLAEPLGVTLTAVAQHLQVLEEAGLARTEKVGRVRACRIEPGGLAALERWIAARRTSFETRLDRLGALLAEAPAGPGLAGLVLAGGASSRFGSEKALAIVDRAPLIQHAADTLARGCDRVAVSARPGSQAAAWALGRGLPVLTDDPRHGQGPLAGVHAGLLWARGLGAERLATAPCDAMRLPPDLVARLADGAGGAIAMTADGELEPLCALWPAAAAEALDAALAEGRHPAARRMAAELGFRSVPFAEPDAFANVNTAEDLARAAGRRQV